MSSENYYSKLFYGLSKKNQELLLSLSVVKNYKKNEHIIEPGNNAAIAFAVEKGMVRSYFIKSGNEITTYFGFRDDFHFPIKSYMLNAKSDEYIQVLTDTEVSIINVNEFNRLKIKDIELLLFDVQLMELIILNQDQRLREFLSMDAKERYLQLLEKEPNIIQNIPLTYIASYLGITLGSLSRIRSII